MFRRMTGKGKQVTQGDAAQWDVFSVSCEQTQNIYSIIKITCNFFIIHVIIASLMRLL